MEGCKVLFVLGLGLCLISSFDYVDGAILKEQVRIYSNDPFGQRENVAIKLEKLRARQNELEANIKRNDWKPSRKKVAEADLLRVKEDIEYIERLSKVSYQDYLQTQIKQNAQYKREMKELQTKLETAAKEEKAKVWSSYKQQFDALAEEKQKIEKEFSTYLEATQLNEQRINEIKEKLNQEKEETIQTLEAAKEKHARTIEALTAKSNEGYKPVRIPEQTKINGLKHDLKKFVSIEDKKKQKEGLLLTKTTLNSLLPELYEKSKFHPETDRKDMEDALAVMEMNTVTVRDEQNKQRKELLEKMKNKVLTELSDEEIASLQKINEELAVTDMFQEEVATRSAYLKGLMEVNDLIKECSDAINAAQQGKIAKFFAEAIEEAKSGNLAKLWTHA